MRYAAPAYAAASAPVAGSAVKIVIIVVVVAVIAVSVGTVALGLGLGLGLGLRKSSSGSSATSVTTTTTIATTTTSTANSSILAAPTVSCNYTGGSMCGCAATKPAFLSSRIIQGYNATANSWPWIVLLLLNNSTILCSGFLVDYQYVITAAHCVFGVKASSMEVYGGVQSDLCTDELTRAWCQQFQHPPTVCQR